jgi:alkylhydroperoxidase/carboxymuconolactone decarboxylase family protein YurZ
MVRRRSATRAPRRWAQGGGIVDAAEDIGRCDGVGRRQRAQGAEHEALQSVLVDLDPTVAHWFDELVFGTVWAPTEIDWDQQMLVALAARGQHAQLRVHLQDGLSAPRLRQTLDMLAVHRGFRTSIPSLVVLQRVIDSERRRDVGASTGVDRA